MPGLWKHNTRPIYFTLVVNNFGMKYTRQEDVDHLKTTLEHNYTVTADWMQKQYIGITLDWDYEQKRVQLSMPNYAKKALQLLQHKVRKEQHAPHSCTLILNGAKEQYAKRQKNHQQLTTKPINSSNKFSGNFYS